MYHIELAHPYYPELDRLIIEHNMQDVSAYLESIKDLLIFPNNHAIYSCEYMISKHHTLLLTIQNYITKEYIDMDIYIHTGLVVWTMAQSLQDLIYK